MTMEISSLLSHNRSKSLPLILCLFAMGWVSARGESIYDLTYQSSRKRTLREVTPEEKYIQKKKVEKRVANFTQKKKRSEKMAFQDRPATIKKRKTTQRQTRTILAKKRMAPKKQEVVFIEKNDIEQTQAVAALHKEKPRSSVFAKLLVSPWDRETLGEREMSLEPLPERANFQEQILASREASAGGFGGVGGGCGCH